MVKKKQQPKTSVGDFDRLDSPHAKPIKKPKQATPASKVKRPKKPKSAKRPK